WPCSPCNIIVCTWISQSFCPNNGGLFSQIRQPDYKVQGIITMKQMLDVRDSPHPPSPSVDERREASPRVSGSKTEFKQRVLIRLEKVETKTISLVHEGRIRIKDHKLPQE
ncbi:hypothetical protein CRENBAI_002955, partial [Crenichthys baileyi]